LQNYPMPGTQPTRQGAQGKILHLHGVVILWLWLTTAWAADIHRCAMGPKARAFIPAQQLHNLDAHARLFLDFTDDGLFRGLTWGHAPTWQFPEARIVALHQKYLLAL